MNRPTRHRFRRGRADILIMVAVVMLASLALSHAVSARFEEQLLVGYFSNERVESTVPSDWTPLTFPKIPQHTSYDLVRDDGRVVIKATSQAASSGLTREVQINPRDYPVIQWQWKVVNVLKRGDVTKKDGDDYPARIYVTFQYDSAKVGLFGKAKYEAARLIYGRYPPLGAINYIWESRAPVGTAVPNPYTEQVHMIVVESGSARLNTWVTEERNVYEDYKRAFGEEPPLISGVAIMTDTDNTGESAEAFYGDIVFKEDAH